MFITNSKIDILVNQLHATPEDLFLTLTLLEETLKNGSSKEDNICQVLYILRFEMGQCLSHAINAGKTTEEMGKKLHKAYRNVCIAADVIKPDSHLKEPNLKYLHTLLTVVGSLNYSKILKKGSQKSKKVVLDSMRETVKRVYKDVTGLKTNIEFEYGGIKYDE